MYNYRENWMGGMKGLELISVDWFELILNFRSPFHFGPVIYQYNII